jgi:glycosyltransferase involved in cell wall biosynthesis
VQRDTFKVKTYPSLSVGEAVSGQNRLRVCIATEEIVGPVRNGGIASTYYHLAKGLASRGHDVHVLYLKGPNVENETPEHWVRHFAAIGITLHYLDFGSLASWGASVHWQQRYAAAYRWFQDQDPFDVVHTSEWRGGLVYVLMAKRLGLAFQDTLFIVKTSSPHIWNRHYQLQPIQKDDLIAAGHAEQKCVELADIVVGGSAHLLTFMEHIGYRMKPADVYVQPNIVDFQEVPVTDLRGPREPGQVIRSREVTFFGRLEARKGIEIFCGAIDILIARGVMPERLNFMGKYGDALPGQGGMKVEEYLARKIAKWPFPVELLTDLNQPAALSFLCSRDMLAVMPSLIENSTMAVYEALEKQVPFIATAVGGTPELIHPDDHGQALVEPTSSAIADRLETALAEGMVIPRSSFSNDENLQIWFDFHYHLADLVAADGRASLSRHLLKDVRADASAVETFAIVALVRSRDGLDGFLDSVRAAGADQVILTATDMEVIAGVETALREGGDADGTIILRRDIGLAAGTALDLAIRAVAADALLLMNDTSVRPEPGLCAMLKTGLGREPDALLTSFFRIAHQTGMPLGGDVASQFRSSRAYGPEAVAMRAGTYRRLGPLQPYDVQSGLIHEYVTRAVEDGGTDLLVLPEVLLAWPTAVERTREYAGDPIYQYLKAKPLIDAGSLSNRKILLAGLSQSGTGTISASSLREARRPKDETVWLVHADKNRDQSDGFATARTLIGLDEASSRVLMMGVGDGERRLLVNGMPAEIAVDDPDSRNSHITLHYWEPPADWPVGQTLSLVFTVGEGEGMPQRAVRLTHVAENTFAAIGAAALLTPRAIREVLERRRAAAAKGTGDRAVSRLHALSGDIDDVLTASKPGRRPRQQAPARQADKPVKVRRSKADQLLLEDLSGGDDVLAVVLSPADRPRRGSSGPKAGARAAARDRAGTSPAPKPRRKVSFFPATAPREDVESVVWATRAGPSGDVRGAVFPECITRWVDGDAIEGWAWDRSDHGRFVHVVALVDGRAVAAARADLVVPRLASSAPGLEQHGFSLRLPPGVQRGATAIEIRLLETREPLKNGIVQVLANHLVAA